MSGGDEANDRVSAEDFAKVEYPEARRILLSEWDNAKEEIEWLVEAGAYLRACWLKENHFLAGKPLDEASTKHVWDEFNASELREIRAKARVALKAYTRGRFVSGLIGALSASMKDAGFSAAVGAMTKVLLFTVRVAKVVGDIAKQMGHGVLHLVGVVLFVLLLKLLFPALWEEGRTAARSAFGLAPVESSQESEKGVMTTTHSSSGHGT